MYNTLNKDNNGNVSLQTNPPRLLLDIRLALAVLYGHAPPPSQHQHHHQQHANSQPTPSQAHEYLLMIQSRNIRRKLQSLQQKYRDQPQSSSSSPMIPLGSVWLACLALLLQQPNNKNYNNHCDEVDAKNIVHVERLFAAQTLLQRLRRSKLEDAIDVELEDNVGAGGGGLTAGCVSEHDLLTMYQQKWLNNHLLLTSILQHWLALLCPLAAAAALAQVSAVNVEHGEKRSDEAVIKGHAMLMTLAAILYGVAAEEQQQPQQEKKRPDGAAAATNLPLVTTLGSAVAILALRLGIAVQMPETAAAGDVADSYLGRQSLVAIMARTMQVIHRVALRSLSSSSSSAAAAASAAYQRAHFVALAMTLRMLPETLLGPVNTHGSSSGGRLSLDPRHIQAMGGALRQAQSLEQVWQALLEAHAESSSSSAAAFWPNKDDHWWLLTTMERWIAFVPLTMDFVDKSSLALLRDHLHATRNDARLQKAALAYLLSILEAGTWTVDQVLSALVGLASEQSLQGGQKRPSSRSKKRHKDLVDTRSTMDHATLAQAEVRQRAEMACRTTVLVWDPLMAAFEAELLLYNKDATLPVAGEAAVACMATSTQVCLPHVVRQGTWADAKDLSHRLASSLLAMCDCGNRNVRMFAFEPIYELHNALVDIVSSRGHLVESDYQVMEVLYKCSVSLASACGYYTDYFDDPSSLSDEELESDRNEVRHLLRTVASPHQHQDSSAVAEMAQVLLAEMLRAHHTSLVQAMKDKVPICETTLHSFSALAKPLNSIVRNGLHSPLDTPREIVGLALNFIEGAIDCLLIEVHEAACFGMSFARCRLACLAIASMSPFLARQVTVHSECGFPLELVHRVINKSAMFCIRTLYFIPEFAAPSRLDCSQLDIRGAMRSPGGEDHVGCLALMRLAYESDEVASVLIGGSHNTHMAELCNLHEELQKAESSRERCVVHGQGVLPKSRRILLGVICHLEIVSKGRGGASSMLSRQFELAVHNIASMHSRFPDESCLFRMCECTYDLAAFPPSIVSQLFVDSPSHPLRANCLKAISDILLRGYNSVVSPTDAITANMEQWNRLRAGLYALIRASGKCDLPGGAASHLELWIEMETKAVCYQCQAGPLSSSPVFNDKIVCSDVIPAGVFIKAIGGIVEGGSILEGATSPRQCVLVLEHTMEQVFAAITHPCPDPADGAFVDPRGTLCEAWLSCLTAVMKSAKSFDEGGESLTNILAESAAGLLGILFMPTLAKAKDGRRCGYGMSLDGPHGLLFTEFFAEYLRLHPPSVKMTAMHLRSRIPYGSVSMQQMDESEADIPGFAIIAASIFRATVGALPPWAVESLPDIFCSFYEGLGKNADLLESILRAALHIRLRATCDYYGVRQGQLLAGPIFEKMANKESLVLDLVAQARLDSATSWRRFKVITKQACGGKKKDTDFQQKPSLTRWEFDRL